MKLEKEVYIGNVYYTEYRDGKYDLNFNCIISNSLTQEEKEIFDKLQEKLKVKLTLETEEPILDEIERKYLSEVIRPFRNRVDYIKKIGVTGGERIIMKIKGSFEYLNLPFFKKGSMYKGMKAETKYTLEDLDL